MSSKQLVPAINEEDVMLDIENMDEDDEEIDEVKMDLTNFDPFSQPIAVAEARNS